MANQEGAAPKPGTDIFALRRYYLVMRAVLRVQIRIHLDPNHFGKSDPDPHHGEKLDLDPRQIQNGKGNTAAEAHTQSVEAHNGAMEAHPEAVEVQPGALEGQDKDTYQNES
jgi:hypothetical protein